jgi:HAD superfamily hydrolase (TIGR01493 family)
MECQLGGVRSGAALDHAAERFGVGLDEPATARLMDTWLELRPFPEVVAALDRLAPRPLVVLSNGSPRMLEERLRVVVLRDQFAHVLSADVQCSWRWINQSAVVELPWVDAL